MSVLRIKSSLDDHEPLKEEELILDRHREHFIERGRSWLLTSSDRGFRVVADQFIGSICVIKQ